MRARVHRKCNDKDYDMDGLAAPRADHRYGPNRRSPCRRLEFYLLVLRERPLAGDPDARRMFECLLAYARLDEGRAGLN